MITVYKKNVLPEGAEVIRINDVYFNKYTAQMLDERAGDIILRVDDSQVLSKYFFASKFDGSKLNIDKLSTGCKSALNIMYNPDIIFDISECGENALKVIYSFDRGNVYCGYPMIAFNMEGVQAVDKKGVHVFYDYDDLRDWWKNED